VAVEELHRTKSCAADLHQSVLQITTLLRREENTSKCAYVIASVHV